MDNMLFLYLLGAFVLGFIIAYFAGRAGLKRALEESEANNHTLQRTVDERNRSVTKLEDTTKQLQGSLDKVNADQVAAVAAAKAAAEQQAQAFADANDRIGVLEGNLRDAEGERLRLTTELGHVSDGLAGARSRIIELEGNLTESLETTEELSAEQEATLALAVGEAAEMEVMRRQIAALKTEVELTQAAASRQSLLVALRPMLTPAKAAEYSAMAADPARGGGIAGTRHGSRRCPQRGRISTAQRGHSDRRRRRIGEDA
ncbi:MAG: hypothetical protein IPK16_18890 [Anaerolineales bacterium]|nr:hypothetical protein [Anaerolineales bacterium]